MKLTYNQKLIAVGLVFVLLVFVVRQFAFVKKEFGDLSSDEVGQEESKVSQNSVQSKNQFYGLKFSELQQKLNYFQAEEKFADLVKVQIEYEQMRKRKRRKDQFVNKRENFLLQHFKLKERNRNIWRKDVAKASKISRAVNETFLQYMKSYPSKANETYFDYLNLRKNTLEQVYNNIPKPADKTYGKTIFTRESERISSYEKSRVQKQRVRLLQELNRNIVRVASQALRERNKINRSGKRIVDKAAMEAIIVKNVKAHIERQKKITEVSQKRKASQMQRVKAMRAKARAQMKLGRNSFRMYSKNGVSYLERRGTGGSMFENGRGMTINGQLIRREDCPIGFTCINLPNDE